MKNIKLNITGMECDACVKHVTNGLLSLNGVESVDVSLSTNSAEVTYKEDVVTVDQMISAVDEEGYGASPAV